MRPLRFGIAVCALGSGFILSLVGLHGGLVSAKAPLVSSSEDIGLLAAVAANPSLTGGLDTSSRALGPEDTAIPIAAPSATPANLRPLYMERLAQAVPQQEVRTSAIGKQPSDDSPDTLPWRELLGLSLNMNEGEPEGAAWWVLGLAKQWFGESEGTSETHAPIDPAAAEVVAVSCRFSLELHGVAAGIPQPEPWAELQLLDGDGFARISLELPDNSADRLLLCDAPPLQGGEYLLEFPLDETSEEIVLSREETALLHGQDRIWMLVTNASRPEGWVSGWWQCESDSVAAGAEDGYRLFTSLAVKDEQVQESPLRADKPNFPDNIALKLPICDIALYQGPTAVGYIAALVDPESGAVTLYIDHVQSDAVQVLIREFVGAGQTGDVLADLGTWANPNGDGISIGHIPHWANLAIGESDFYVEVIAPGAMNLRADPTSGCDADLSLLACYAELTPEPGFTASGQMVRITNTLSNTTWLYMVHDFETPQYLMFYGESETEGEGEGEGDEELIAALLAPAVNQAVDGVFSSAVFVCCPGANPLLWRDVQVSAMPTELEGEPEGVVEGRTEGGPEGSGEGEVEGEGAGEGEGEGCNYECPDWELVAQSAGPIVMTGSFDCDEYSGPFPERPVVYVDDSNVGGSEDGTTRYTAFRSIQDAVEVAEDLGGADVWVAGGVYTGLHASAGSCLTALELRDNVRIYGGFPPGGGPLSSRDWLKHQTWIMGIEGDFDEPGDRANHVVMADGVTNAHLEGVFIAGGLTGAFDIEESPEGEGEASACTEARGGGLYVRNTGMDVTFRNLTFFFNFAALNHEGGLGGGGAAYFEDSSSSLKDSRLLSNIAYGNGAGLFVSGGAPQFDNLLIAGNVGWGTAQEPGHGAGIYVDNSSTLSVLNSTITGNVSSTGISGIYDALRTDTNPWPTLYNSILWNNGDSDFGEGILGYYSLSGDLLPGADNLVGNPLFRVLKAGKWSETMQIVGLSAGKRIDDHALNMVEGLYAGKVLLLAESDGFLNLPGLTVIQDNTDSSIRYPGALSGDPQPGEPYWILDYALDPLSPAVDTGYNVDPEIVPEGEGATEGEGEGATEGSLEGEGSPEGEGERAPEGEETPITDEDSDFFRSLRGFDGDGLGSGTTGDGTDYDMGYIETVSLEHGIVLFPDPGLDAAVRFELGIMPEIEITVDMVADPAFVSLNASNSDIADLSGLEYCIHLETLDLSGNPRLVHVGELKQLWLLESLDLGGCAVADISTLGNLTSLNELNLAGNQISNIDALELLVDLAQLDLSDNNIGSVEALRGLFGFEQLNLSANDITDFEPIISPSLTGATIDLRNNPITLTLLCDQVAELESHANTVEHWGDCDENATNLRLDVIVAGGGKVYPFSGTNYYPPDEEVSLTAYSPNEDVVFNYWSGHIGENNPQSSNIYLTMASDHLVTAHFSEAAQITVGATEGGGGFTRYRDFIHAEPLSVPMGSQVELLDAPNESYIFDHWEITHVTDGLAAAPSLPSEWQLLEQSMNEDGNWVTVAEATGAPLTFTVLGDTFAIPHYKELRRVSVSYEDANATPITLAAEVAMDPTPHTGRGRPEGPGHYYPDGTTLSVGPTLAAGYELVGFTHGPDGAMPTYLEGDSLNVTLTEDYTIVVRVALTNEMICQQTVIGGENGMPISDYFANIEVVKTSDSNTLQVRVNHNVPDLKSITWLENAPRTGGAPLGSSEHAFLPNYVEGLVQTSIFTLIGADGYILLKSEEFPDGVLKCPMDCGNKLTITQVGEGILYPFSNDTRTYLDETSISIFSPTFDPHRRIDFVGDFDPEVHLTEDEYETSLDLPMDQDREITATFIKLHGLSIQVSGSGSVTATQGSTQHPIPHGNYVLLDRGNVTLEAEADTGYAFSGWETVSGSSFVDDATDATTTLNLVSHTGIRATFKPLVTLTLATDGSGSTSPTAGQHTVMTGASFQAEATPATGYRFERWDTSGPISFDHPTDRYLESATVTVNGNATLTAKFVAVDNLNCRIILDGFTGDSASESPARGVARLVRTTSQSSVALEIEHNVSGATTAGIYATDDDTLTVDLGSVSGTISASLSSTQYDTITQEPHYVAVNSSNHSDGEIRGIIGACVDYVVTVVPDENGSVTLTTPAGTITDAVGYYGVNKVSGAAPQVTVDTVPDEGYILQSWIWNLAPDYDRYWEEKTFTLNGDMEVGADFAVAKTLRVKIPENGIIQIFVYSTDHQLSGYLDGDEYVYAVPPGAQLNAFAQMPPGGMYYPNDWGGSAATAGEVDRWSVLNIVMDQDHTLEAEFGQAYALVLRGYGCAGFRVYQGEEEIEVLPAEYLHSTHAATVYGDPNVTIEIEDIQPGYTFRRWIDDKETKVYGLDETLQVTLDPITSEKPFNNINAEFYRGSGCVGCSDKVTLEIAVEGAGNTVPAPGLYLFHEGEIVDLNAIARNSSQFNHWQINGNENLDAIQLFEIFSDTKAIADFDERLRVTATGTNGSVYPPVSWSNYGDSVALQAIADPGYEITHWILNNDLENPVPVASPPASPNTLVLEIFDHFAVEAVFEVAINAEQDPQYSWEPWCNAQITTISIGSAGTGDGTVSPPAGTQYCAGQTVRITAFPYPGSEFVRWIGLPSEYNETLSDLEVPITDAHNLIAEFDLIDIDQFQKSGLEQGNIPCKVHVSYSFLGQGVDIEWPTNRELFLGYNWVPKGSEVTFTPVGESEWLYFVDENGVKECYPEEPITIKVDSPIIVSGATAIPEPVFTKIANGDFAEYSVSPSEAEVSSSMIGNDRTILTRSLEPVEITVTGSGPRVYSYSKELTTYFESPTATVFAGSSVRVPILPPLAPTDYSQHYFVFFNAVGGGQGTFSIGSGSSSDIEPIFVADGAYVLNQFKFDAKGIDCKNHYHPPILGNGTRGPYPAGSSVTIEPYITKEQEFSCGDAPQNTSCHGWRRWDTDLQDVDYELCNGAEPPALLEGLGILWRIFGPAPLNVALLTNESTLYRNETWECISNQGYGMTALHETKTWKYRAELKTSAEVRWSAPNLTEEIITDKYGDTYHIFECTESRWHSRGMTDRAKESEMYSETYNIGENCRNSRTLESLTDRHVVMRSSITHRLGTIKRPRIRGDSTQPPDDGEIDIDCATIGGAGKPFGDIRQSVTETRESSRYSCGEETCDANCITQSTSHPSCVSDWVQFTHSGETVPLPLPSEDLKRNKKKSCSNVCNDQGSEE